MNNMVNIRRCFGASRLVSNQCKLVFRFWAFAQLLLFACYGKSPSEASYLTMVRFIDPRYPAKILLKPQDTTVELNTKVSFFCRAGGNPLPTVVWKRNGKPVSQPRYLIDSNADGLSTLRIEQLRDRDNQTEFSCTADNGKGRPDTATARLIVLAPANLPRGFPAILEDPKLKAVEKGHVATMSCSVQGDPTPKVIWLRDLMPVDMTNPRYSIATLGSPGSLMIQNSEESDEGKYECVAQNAKGVVHSRSAHLYVKVRRVPPHFSIPPRRKYHVMPGGRVNITCAAVGHPMPKVFWRKGFDENLDGGAELAPIGRNVLNLTGVMQSENYTCVAFSKLGHIEASASVEVKSIPEAPSSIKVHNVTSSSLVLQWTPAVISESDEPVKHYVIQYKPKYAEGLEPVEKSTSESSVVVSGLDPYTQYEFTIATVTDVGRSSPSRPLEATTAEAAPGSPPKAVQSRVLGGNQGIYVTWEAPDKPNGKILDYAVYYTVRESDPYSMWTKLNVSGTSAQILSAQMEVLYTIQVAARNAIGYSPMSAKSQVLTTPGIPGQPTNLKATPLSGDKILLTWDPPLYASTDIVQYAILYNSSVVDSGTVKELIIPAQSNIAPKTTVENLKPNSNYSFYVVGISSRGRGVPSASIIARTSPAVPSGPPEGVVVEPFSSKALRIMWEPPPKSDQNGLIVNYKIAWEPVSNDVDDGEPGEKIEPASKDRPRSVVVDGLVPYTEYKITVAAGTEKGFGPLSPAVTSRTLDDVPGPPQNLEVTLDGVDNSSVHLTWDAPLERNGILVGYNIFVEELENNKVKTSGSRMPRARTSADITTYTFADLKPNTEYSFQVNAYNRRGDGQVTKAKILRMPPRKPSEPRNFEIRLITMDTAGDMNRLNKAKLTWHPPADQSGSTFKGYTVRYRTEGGPVTEDWKQFSTQHTEASVSDLRMGRTYEFRVAAENEQGLGKEAINSLKTPDGVPTSAPLNTTCRSNSRSGSLTCSWQPPLFESRNGQITEYETWLISQDGSNTTVPTPVTETTYKVSANKTFQFRVRAKTSKGFGPWSAVTQVSTAFQAATSNLRTFVSNEHESEPLNSQRYDALKSEPIGTFHRDKDDNDYTHQSRRKLHPHTRQHISNSKYRTPMPQSTRWWHPLLDDLPNPTNVRAQALTNDSALVMWTPVVNEPKVIGYRVHYTAEPSKASWEVREVADRNMGRMKLTGLIARKTYSLCVSSFGHQIAGDCYGSGLIEFKMEPREVVTNLEAFENPREYGGKVKLTWDYYSPFPVQYLITGYGHKVYKTETGDVKSLNDVLSRVVHNPAITGKAREFELPVRPYSNYSVDVAVISNGKTYLPQTVNFTTRPTAPPVVEEILFVKAADTKSVKVKLKPATEEYGPIKKYWVIVTPMEYRRKAGMETQDLMNRIGNSSGDDAWVAAELSPHEMSRIAMKEGEFIIGDGQTYGAYKNVPLRSGRKYVATLRAFGDPGADDDGTMYTDSVDSKEFSAQAVPMAGDADQATIQQGDQHLWIIGPVVAILVVAIIVGAICFFLLHRNKKKSLPTNRGSISKVMAPASEKTPMLMSDNYGGAMMPHINGSAVLPYDTSAPDSGYGGDNVEMRRMNQQQHHQSHYPVPFVSSSASTNGFAASRPPIPIIELAAHIERLKASENLLFSQEYESIETGQQLTWENSNMDANKPKNRYANVIAYDHSRVKLMPLDRVPHSDYINANYIDGYRTKKAYIATQGPLPETFGDFWRMVWEENSATIVMLTKLEEKTRIKCDQYWPTRGSALYGIVVVTLKETHELAHYTIRTFDIHRQGQNEIREIKQLQFTAWPDHGAPEHPTPFLMFLKRVKNMNASEAGPVVVHCSAGVGRTGAFIVIDIQLERLRYENTVDIYGCVASIRSQRNYMVQTEDQYIFIYDAVLDAVQSGCTEVPVAKLYMHIQKLMQVQPLENASAMEIEFRQLSAVKLPNTRFTAANLPCNKQKNRLVNILPYDSTRACLSPSSDGAEGSDYINASFIDGYKRRRAYIATQGPLPNTVDDFWRMLWEHNSTIIVMLTKFREMGREICEKCHRYKPVAADSACVGEYRLVEKCCQYWPSDRAERYGGLVVEPIAEYNMTQYVLREFKLTDSRDGQSRTVRHFQYTEWPEQGVPKSSDNFVDFIGQVLKTKEQFGLDGPITVHCSAGVGRTGVFITLSIVLERMRYECVVDIFTTVKLLRTQRPNMVQSEDQYHFCYQAALEYLGSFDYSMQSYE